MPVRNGRKYNLRRRGAKVHQYRAVKRIAQRLHAGSKVGRILGAGKFHPFPPELSSTLKTTFNCNVVASLTTAPKGNAYDIIVPANVVTNVGPFINYPLGTLSSEQTNVPSGVYYLLGAEKFDGSSPAPYNRYFVRSSSIRVTMTPSGDVSNGNRPIQVVILPLSDNASQIAETLTTNTLLEQEHVKRVLIPPSLTSTLKPMRNSLSTKEAFGLKHLDNQDSTYCGSSGAEPQNIWSWIVRMSNVGNLDTAVWNMMVEIEITQHVTFFDRNLMTSTVVGLGGATGAQGTYEIHPSTGATGDVFAYISGNYNPIVGLGSDQTFIPA